MKIFTSSWFVKLPPGVQRIGISRGTPRQQQGYRMYRALAPGPWFRSADDRTYRQLYFEQLDSLDAQKVADDILALADGKTPALLCFEPPKPGPAWCHRAYVSVWLQDRLGLEVYEWGQEHEGFGWAHPKMPPMFRQVEYGPLLDGAATGIAPA